MEWQSFIQRKGWLNRRRDYLISAFNHHYSKDREGLSFYNQFLRPFFVKLSAEDAYFPNLDLGDLPFLTGGLFDEEIGSLTERGRMKVGNPVLRYVFDHLLEAYNFTVREDTPLDQEVAIDPEMLGKIFDRLASTSCWPIRLTCDRKKSRNSNRSCKMPAIATPAPALPTSTFISTNAA